MVITTEFRRWLFQRLKLAKDLLKRKEDGVFEWEVTGTLVLLDLRVWQTWSAGFQPTSPEVNAGAVMLQNSWAAGTHPIFIKIRQSVCHPWSKSTESPFFPGQVFNTQWCSCHQSGDSVKCHGVRYQEKRFSKSWLKALVLKVLDYIMLPTDTCPSHQNSSYRASSGLKGLAW